MEFYDPEYPVHAWSRSRHKMRKLCRKKAILYYRDARNGASPDADTPARQLHERRNRIPLQAYLQRQLKQLIREAFYSRFPEEENTASAALSSPEAISAALHNRFDRDFMRMLEGGSSYDHHLCFIRELEDPHCRITELMRRAGEEITRLTGNLTSALWKLIAETPLLSRREIASPLQVNINDLCCYCAPLFALERNGELWIVETYCDDLTVLLHKFYAVNTSGREPHLVRSFSYTPETGDFSEAGLDLNVSDALRQISADGAEWAELLKHPAETIPGNFEHCKMCEFSILCNKHFQKNGGKI